MSPMRCLMVVGIISFQKKLREDGIDEEKVMLPVLSLVDSFAVVVAAAHAASVALRGHPGEHMGPRVAAKQ